MRIGNQVLLADVRSKDAMLFGRASSTLALWRTCYCCVALTLTAVSLSVSTQGAQRS